MFYACFTLIGGCEGDKNFRVGIYLNKNFFFRPDIKNLLTPSRGEQCHGMKK